ncbi:NADPH-dependent FMN reductase [Streptomyces venezuelae]|uniref:NADPH-dependent FMN reductase n=1 Tax=Streptomyces venezuelae TaxID=54571 RepID=A0A5P2DTP7_STRVZ|nr:NAD(P)H-dependent oxidoreductase [Streptomyces venezuelae]QES58564.1 NADPH-dependent FMN reductase [Streptomyces venezuelae]
MNTPLRIALVVGSTREGRFGPTVARWFETAAAGRTDIELTVADLADADLPAHWTPSLTPRGHAFVEQLARADAYVILTPEYNHSFPASLKQAIDTAGHVWRRKPVGFVSYGGLSGGLRAVEQLRPVFAELHATTVRETVSFHQFPFDETGAPRDADGARTAVTVLLDDLLWWGHALRTARRQDEAQNAAA